MTREELAEILRTVAVRCEIARIEEPRRDFGIILTEVLHRVAEVLDTGALP